MIHVYSTTLFTHKKLRRFKYTHKACNVLVKKISIEENARESWTDRTSMNYKRLLDTVQIIKLFPPRKSLVSDIPAGDGNVANLFLQCTSEERQSGRIQGASR